MKKDVAIRRAEKREYTRRWKKENPEKVKEWYRANRNRILAKMATQRQEALQWVIGLKQTQGCARCRNTDPEVLHFHHLHGKKGHISTMIYTGLPLDKIKTEISKCELLCANCHRKEHWKPFQCPSNRPGMQKKHDMIWQHKLQNPCKCGVMDPRCLDFHHTDRENKTNIISRMRRSKMSKLIDEIAKCETVCANCHMKIHASKDNPRFFPQVGSLPHG
jgi:hypothetical protein